MKLNHATHFCETKDWRRGSVSQKFGDFLRHLNEGRSEGKTAWKFHVTWPRHLPTGIRLLFAEAARSRNSRFPDLLNKNRQSNFVSSVPSLIQKIPFVLTKWVMGDFCSCPRTELTGTRRSAGLFSSPGRRRGLSCQLVSKLQRNAMKSEIFPQQWKTKKWQKLVFFSVHSNKAKALLESGNKANTAEASARHACVPKSVFSNNQVCIWAQLGSLLFCFVFTGFPYFVSFCLFCMHPVVLHRVVCNSQCESEGQMKRCLDFGTKRSQSYKCKTRKQWS